MNFTHSFWLAHSLIGCILWSLEKSAIKHGAEKTRTYEYSLRRSS